MCLNHMLSEKEIYVGPTGSLYNQLLVYLTLN
jgi:hypothetical protein